MNSLAQVLQFQREQVGNLAQRRMFVLDSISGAIGSNAIREGHLPSSRSRSGVAVAKFPRSLGQGPLPHKYVWHPLRAKGVFKDGKPLAFKPEQRSTSSWQHIAMMCGPPRAGPR